MSNESNYIKCIKKDVKGSRETLCGRTINMEFVFENIDHAYFVLKNEGRLLPCKECAREVINTFAKLVVDE